MGKATHCSKNKLHINSRYHWSNKSRQYLKSIDDWVQLCPSCHKKYDGTSNKVRRTSAESLRGQTYHARPVSCLDLKISWASTKQAAADLKTCKKVINNCLRGRCKTSLGYRWKYARIV